MADDNLLQVLDGYEHERIELGVNFLNQALVAATLNDNHECIGKLIKMGAKNISECLQMASEKGIIKATAILLLMKAAVTGDRAIVCGIVNTSLCSPEIAMVYQLTSKVYSESQVKEVMLNGRLSTLAPLEVAQQNGQHSVQRELLMLTQVNKHEGCVNWSKLNLMTLDVQLLRRMCGWLKTFNLSSNNLKCVPEELKVLSKVKEMYSVRISRIFGTRVWSEAVLY